jgi:glycerol-3-phosphate dehydrogenase
LYGREYVEILHLVLSDRRLAEVLPSGEITAQVVFAVTHEGARTLSDIVDRRLVLGTVGRVSVEALRLVAGVAGPLLGWDAQRQVDEVVAEDARRTSLAATARRG